MTQKSATIQTNLYHIASMIPGKVYQKQDALICITPTEQVGTGTVSFFNNQNKLAIIFICTTFLFLQIQLFFRISHARFPTKCHLHISKLDHGIITPYCANKKRFVMNGQIEYVNMSKPRTRYIVPWYHGTQVPWYLGTVRL